MGSVLPREVSPHGRCPPMGGVPLREVSISGGWTVLESLCVMLFLKL